MERGSGLLVHISSLPSTHGIGTFGKASYEFINFLKSAGQKYWQVLPLNPTSYGDSPYQSFSAFALNSYFIDLDVLVEEGYLTNDDVKNVNGGSNPHYVDYGIIYKERYIVLRKAYNNEYPKAKTKIKKFITKNKYWINDYALFMVLKYLNDGHSFQEWKDKYRLYNKEALDEIKVKYEDDINFWIYLQYKAYEQYLKLKEYASLNGIKIIGDMPIYVAPDSADVWSHPELFQLDKDHRPTRVAGCPPDYFSKTGQLWGNPLYDWDKHKKTHYAWWKKRISAMAELFDALRIDHFRGFEAYWSIPYGDKTAVNGMWVKGPGYSLFEAIKEVSGNCQIIAEDLGLITKEVKALKKKCGFPGMKVMQFAFGDYDKCLTTSGKKTPDYSLERSKKEKLLTNPYLPHNFETNCLGYIGTHDNDTEFSHLSLHPEEKSPMKDYFHLERDEDILDTLIGSLMRSRCDVVIFMPQDLLHLDTYTRMNTPNTCGGNWEYRFLKEDFSDQLASDLRIMVNEANR